MNANADIIRIHPEDTVAVALRPLAKGEKVTAGNLTLTTKDEIPAGHKIHLFGAHKNDRIIKYGYPIGKAKTDICEGAHVHTHNVETLLSQESEYHYDPEAAQRFSNTGAALKEAPLIEAYVRKNGGVGIRNEVWIVPTVGCVNLTAQRLAAWAHAEFAEGKDSLIDGAFAWTHPYGCSQMGEDHAKTRTILADLVKHPNAGAVLVLGLGCENNTIEEFKKELGDYDGSRVLFLVTQKVEDEIEEGKKLLRECAAFASRSKREPVSAARLVIGMKCGGSDGFSGITANALVGRVTDTITAMGGSAILTEVPEMFGAEQMLMDRCESKAVFEKTVALIENFKRYYTDHGQVVYENPSPGNKEGGITTLEDKSCGCVQKGGKAPVRGVLEYGEILAGTGLHLLNGPGNDIVSTTAMTAAGAHIILFTTGRGTPLGAPVPTIKIASNTALAKTKPGWIDFDAGRLLSEDADTVLKDLMGMIYDIASNNAKTKNEMNGYREIAIFKDGVTL